MLPTSWNGSDDVSAVFIKRSTEQNLRSQRKEWNEGRQASERTSCLINRFRCVFVVTQQWRGNSPLSVSPSRPIKINVIPKYRIRMMALINGTEKLYCRVLTHHHFISGYRIFDVIFAFCTLKKRGEIADINIFSYYFTSRFGIYIFQLHIKLARKIRFQMETFNIRYSLLEYDSIRKAYTFVCCPCGTCGEEVEIEIQIKYECQWHYRTNTHPIHSVQKYWIRINTWMLYAVKFVFHFIELDATGLVWYGLMVNANQNTISHHRRHCVRICFVFRIFNYNGIPIYSYVFYKHKLGHVNENPSI